MSFVKYRLKKGGVYARRAYDFVRSLSPERRRAAGEELGFRMEALRHLDDFSRQPSGQAPAARRVLVDGMWDNPNYWMRYCQLRRALNLSGAEEVGLIGRYARSNVKASFAALGIDSTIDLVALTGHGSRYRKEARRLIAGLSAPGDINTWDLPAGFPGSMVYDGILKRQRRGRVDLGDPFLADYVSEFLALQEAVDGMISGGGFDLVVCSQALDFVYSLIAWTAIQHGIPVLILYGDYGVPRFLRMTEPQDLFCFPIRPTIGEIETMAPEPRARLEAAGAEYLRRRLAGGTMDIGGVYAYHRRRGEIDRTSLAARYGWDPAKPVVGVYAANWFDYPHASGLVDFDDFVEWSKCTIDVAARNTDVNWLFKSHPCDDWYPSNKGMTFQHFVDEENVPHVRLADKSWNGTELIRALDGIVTCHGTVGVEAASMGKPVLVPYDGWYGHAGFTVTARARGEYLEALETDWWRDVDIDAAVRRANLFAGWFFCLPDWRGACRYQDDSHQGAIYPGIPSFVTNQTDFLLREVDALREWFDSGHRYYHIHRMARAEAYTTGLDAPEAASIVPENPVPSTPGAAMPVNQRA